MFACCSRHAVSRFLSAPVPLLTGQVLRFVIVENNDKQTSRFLLRCMEWLVGDDPFYVKFWVNRPPLEQNHRF